MSDVISAMLGTAGLAQSAFGDVGGGIASRLQAALGLELARARTDAQFATAAVASAALAGVVERRSEASPAWPSLLSEQASAARDGRTRVSEREHDPEHDGRHEDPHGADDEQEQEQEGGGADNEVTALPRWQFVAIQRGLQAASDAAVDAGCSGVLHGMVLPGSVGNGSLAKGTSADGPPCTVFVLFTAFDGDLGDTRRVWGFGYADTVLAATLDGRRDHAGQQDESPYLWTVERQQPIATAGGGGLRRLVLTTGNERWIGLLVDDDARHPMPAQWSFSSRSGPVRCPA